MASAVLDHRAAGAGTAGPPRAVRLTRPSRRERSRDLMTIDDFLPLLEQVRSTSRGFVARCPGHGDKTPSLSLCEGQDGRILIRCFSGCSAEEITRALGLRLSDLFFDNGEPDYRERQYAIQQRAQERVARQAIERAKGRHTDALREADYLVRTAQGLSIATWTDDELATALDSVGRAWQLLEAEGLQHA